MHRESFCAAGVLQPAAQSESDGQATDRESQEVQKTAPDVNRISKLSEDENGLTVYPLPTMMERESQEKGHVNCLNRLLKKASGTLKARRKPERTKVPESFRHRFQQADSSANGGTFAKNVTADNSFGRQQRLLAFGF